MCLRSKSDMNMFANNGSLRWAHCYSVRLLIVVLVELKIRLGCANNQSTSASSSSFGKLSTDFLHNRKNSLDSFWSSLKKALLVFKFAVNSLGSSTIISLLSDCASSSNLARISNWFFCFWFQIWVPSPIRTSVSSRCERLYTTVSHYNFLLLFAFGDVIIS